MKLMDKLLHWLLRLFPKDFRNRHEEEVVDLLTSKSKEIRERRGRMAVIFFWTFHVFDLVWSAVQERQEERWSMTQRHRSGDHLVTTLVREISYALRGFQRQPMFTAVAILTLALGIGATTAIFSVVNGVLLKPLRLDRSDELVAVSHTAPGLGFDEIPASRATYLIFRDESRVFEDIGLWQAIRTAVTGMDQPEQVQAVRVTDGIFPLLRIRAAIGRRFVPDDVAPEAAPTVILGNGYWRRRFGGDRNVLGRSLRIDGVESEIIGVMPEGFRFLQHDPAIYLPFQIDRSTVALTDFSYQAIARLRPGVGLSEALDDAARMLPLAPKRFSRGLTADMLEDARFGTIVRPLKDVLIGDIGSVLWVLLGAVGLVLFIACANVGNLFLVRAETRQREIAIRSAIGAARSRIAVQSLVESTLFGILGGALGLGVAYVGLRLLLRIGPGELPRLSEITIDPTVLLFCFVISTLAGLLFGLFPVMHHGRLDVAVALRGGERGASDAPQRHRLRNLLAAFEVAVSLILLIGSGLMIRSFQALRNIEPGFERPGEVFVVSLTLTSSEIRDPERAAQMVEQVLDRVTRLPGVTSATSASSVPMGPTGGGGYAIELEDFPTRSGQLPPVHWIKFVAADYFATMESPVLAGRSFTRDDIRERKPVVVVAENFARKYWGEVEDAVGKRIRPSSSEPWREIIGVVGNVHDNGVARNAPATVYIPFVLADFDGDGIFVQRRMTYAIRTTRPSPMTLLPEVRQVVWSLNSNLPLANAQTLDEILARSMARTSFALVMLGIATVVAVALGAVGTYGVISYVVARRTREIGVRMALGAQQQDVRQLVLLQGGFVALVGVAIGLPAAAGLTRLMTAMLFDVKSVDPLTYGVAAAGIAAVSLLACYVPARRATRVSPIVALREE